MRALILCGGRGTRSWPATSEVPKPMLRLGDKPMLHHVMDIFAVQGVTDFVLAGGYRIDVIDDYLPQLPSEWTVQLVDTGEDADTGDRVVACRERLGDVGFVTYGDGLGDVDLTALRRRHDSHDGTVTVTVVPLPSQYGTLAVDSADRVERFEEKPVIRDRLINAGFFVFDRESLHPEDSGSLERDLLPGIAERGELFIHRHNGFWRSMDTLKDITELEQVAIEEGFPWLPKPA